VNYLLSEKGKFRIIRTVKGVKCSSCPLKDDNGGELPCSLRVTMDPKFSFIRVICGYCDFKSKVYYKDILAIEGILDEHAKVKKLE
tara:strand:+ start:418 stop:675 length:258 start_codon:yes stop_codon:yes gene_type:complete